MLTLEMIVQRILDVFVGASVVAALAVLFSCSQTDAPAPIPATVAPLPTVTQPAVTSVQASAPAAALPSATPQATVTNKTPAKVRAKAKRSTVSHNDAAERAAYAKAYANAALANKLLGEHRYNIPANFAHIALQQT